MPHSLKLLWLVGFSVAGILCIFWHLNNSGTIGPFTLDANTAFQNLTILLWSSSLMLLGISHSHLWIIETTSIVVNGLIYIGVGFALVNLFRKLSYGPDHSTSETSGN